MKRSFFAYLREPKTLIGWVHGITATLGAVILAYLGATLLSIVITGDYARRIIPMMIMTPILFSIFGLWLLFSKSLAGTFLKLFGASVILSLAIAAYINGLI